jgi:uncharacterized protein YbjT (DUF2867 family)
MKIIITGSLGNISRRLTEQLMQKGHDIAVISHSIEKQAAIKALGAKAAIGSIADYDFLREAFKGADAAYIMMPPNSATTDMNAYLKAQGDVYAKAIEDAGVKHIVVLSGIGAHLPAGIGPSGSFHYVEQKFNKLPDTNVLYLRAGMFYTNFYGNLGMIKDHGIIGNNYPADAIVALIHPHDIADAAAQALDSLSFTGKEVRYIVSEERTGAEIAAILGDAFGKPNLPWIQFTDEELLNGAMQNGFSQHMASNFVEMGRALASGKLWEHYNYFKPDLSGKRSFREFAGILASA